MERSLLLVGGRIVKLYCLTITHVVHILLFYESFPKWYPDYESELSKKNAQSRNVKNDNKKAKHCRPFEEMEEMVNQVGTTFIHSQSSLTIHRE